MYNFNKSIKGSLDLMQELNQFRQNTSLSDDIFVPRFDIYFVLFNMLIHLCI